MASSYLETHLYCQRQKCTGPVEFIHRPATRTVRSQLEKIFENIKEIAVEHDHNSVVIRARNTLELYQNGIRAHYALKAHNLHQDVSFGPI